MQKKEWVKFSVGSPSTRHNWTNRDCVPFSSLDHVTHIKTSLPILIDRRIKSGLVFDESILNQQRILVSWLSPNVWGGYRYGNVRLRFKFNNIIENKKFYWIESIAYGVPACRILITAKKHEGLSPYNPMKKYGPWWFDVSNEQHYFNGHYCLEFMVEDDLLVTQNVELDFVSHHERWCSINRNNPSKCSDLGLAEWHSAGLFLATVLADSINFPVQLFKNDKNDGIPRTLKYCWSGLCFNLTEVDNVEFNGEISHKDEVAIPLSRAMCNAFAYSSIEEERAIISMFKSKKDLTKSLAKLITIHFSISNWEDFIKKRK